MLTMQSVRFQTALMLLLLLCTPSSLRALGHKQCLSFTLNCRQCLHYGCVWGQSHDGSPACSALLTDFIGDWRVLLSPGSEQYCSLPFRLCGNDEALSTATCPPCNVGNTTEDVSITKIAAVFSLIFSVLAILYFLVRRRDDIRHGIGAVHGCLARAGTFLRRHCRRREAPASSQVGGNVELRRGRRPATAPIPHPVVIAPDSDTEEFVEASSSSPIPGPSTSAAAAAYSLRRSERIQNQMRSCNPFYGPE